MTKHLGEFEQLLLFAVLRLRDEAYGTALRQEIERRTGRVVAIGAVYTALNRLEAKGLVTSQVEQSPAAEALPVGAFGGPCAEKRLRRPGQHGDRHAPSTAGAGRSRFNR